MPHIWDVLEQLDKEDKEAMQEAYNLVGELRKGLWELKNAQIALHTKKVNKLYEMACMLEHLIAHWWEIYVEKQRKRGEGG